MLDSYISLRGRTDDRKFINDAKQAIKVLTRVLA